jgi:regulator of sirC expression with transglutaminase-like and TPR domain
VSDPRSALDAIGRLPDTEIDIAGAALQLARVDAPEADWQAAQTHLSELARDGARMAASMTTDELSLRAEGLTRLIAGEHRYAGDSETYDDLANANLIRVMERRQGLPVALGILWLHVIRAAGWSAHGIDFPGHFLIALEGRSRKVTLDVFDGGRLLEARDLRALIKRVEGDKAELRPGLMLPISTRDVLLRLQNNILTRGHAAHRTRPRRSMAARRGDAPTPRSGVGRAGLFRALPEAHAARRGRRPHPRRDGRSAHAAQLSRIKACA